MFAMTFLLSHLSRGHHRGGSVAPIQRKRIGRAFAFEPEVNDVAGRREFNHDRPAPPVAEYGGEGFPLDPARDINHK
jgi:hypothetical protein